MKKPVCAVCAADRGRRGCQLRDGILICPVCCARLRTPACAGCGHWAQAAAFAKTKTEIRNEPSFIAASDPEIDDEVDQALAMAERGQVVTAEHIIAGLLDRRPDLPIVHFGMGVIRALQGRHAEALLGFERAIAIFPPFVEAWYNKGAAHQKLLEFGPMVRAYQQVVKLGDPSDEYVGKARDLIRDLDEQHRANRGLSLDRSLLLMDLFEASFAVMQDGNWEKALSGFQKVLSEDPKSVQANGNAGLCLAFLGRKQEALAAFDRALALDPSYEPAQINRRGVMALGEGEKLAANFLSVDYYKDRARNRR